MTSEFNSEMKDVNGRETQYNLASGKSWVLNTFYSIISRCGTCGGIFNLFKLFILKKKQKSSIKRNYTEIRTRVRGYQINVKLNWPLNQFSCNNRA